VRMCVYACKHCLSRLWMCARGDKGRRRLRVCVCACVCMLRGGWEGGEGVEGEGLFTPPAMVDVHAGCSAIGAFRRITCAFVCVYVCVCVCVCICVCVIVCVCVCVHRCAQ
jgi:hypothetical protein